MKRVILSIGLFLLVCSSGCSSDRDALEKICAEVESVALMTNDCDVMGEKLAPLTTSFVSVINKIATQEHDVNARKQYVDVTSRCLRSYMEIETGTCGKNEKVKAALPGDKLSVRNK